VHNQPAEIAAAVTRLLEDLPLARTLGRNGRALVEDRFTVDRMADLTLDAYRQVIG
jgi:glycosyltransferase involved in cell wall biosynthesis